jgi:CBS domain-containing protein
MTVLDIARTNVVTVDLDTSVADVVRTMREKTVGSVVVTDGDVPVGYVTDRDLAMSVLDEQFDAEGTPIREQLDEELVTIDADAGVYDLVELLSERGIRRVPVVDDGELAGIVSISDIVVLLGMELQHLATAIRSSSPAYERSGPDYYQQ